jgi:tripartite-type tricarboxylate transporter receptor subunit TctC
MMRGLAFLLSLLAGGGAVAQESYPARPVHIVVGYAAGGGNDIIARLVAQKMSESLKQPVIVDNKPGAQGIIATEAVARAKPDGYTLMVGPSGPLTVNPVIYAKLPYDPSKDFAPISRIGAFPLILVTGAQQSFRSVADIVAFAKKNPDGANYGASAASFQLVTELFKQRTGTGFVHIPYKGSGESLNAVIAGDVTMAIIDSIPAAGALKGGTARGLAVTSPTRAAEWPDIPTMKEAGVPEMEVSLWTGLLAPAGTPAPIVETLHGEIARIVALPDIKERFAQLGVDPIGGTPKEFRQTIEREIALWRDVAKKAGIEPQ